MLALPAIREAQAFAFNAKAVEYRNRVFVALAAGYLNEPCTRDVGLGFAALVDHELVYFVQRDRALRNKGLTLCRDAKLVWFGPAKGRSHAHIFVCRVIPFAPTNYVFLVTGRDRNDVAYLRECEIAHSVTLSSPVIWPRIIFLLIWK